MSSHNSKRRRRQVHEIPVLVERVQREQQEDKTNEDRIPHGMTYEEYRWPHLSPQRRDSHNKLLQARGLPTIPPPRVDLYVAPQESRIRPFDESDPEFRKQIALANRQPHHFISAKDKI